MFIQFNICYRLNCLSVPITNIDMDSLMLKELLNMHTILHFNLAKYYTIILINGTIIVFYLNLCD